nr:hypothetical protein [Tanacetum cinerariifolium]
FDAQPHALSGAQEHRFRLDAQAHSRRCASGNHVARLQAHELTQVAHQFRDLENHRACVAVLVTLAIHFQPQVELVRVGDFVAGHQPGADRAEGVTAFALVPGAAALDLKLALRHIVDHAVAGHVLQGVGFVDVASALADDHTQLDFPVGLLRIARNFYVVVRPHNGARPLVENDGLFGNVGAGFRRVVGVVQADADELADLAHTGANARCALHQRQGGRVGQVANAAVAVQQGRTFLTGFAVTQQFHGVSSRREVGVNGYERDGRAGSVAPAAVDDLRRAGGKAAGWRAKVQRQLSNFLRRAQAADGLACFERRVHLGFITPLAGGLIGDTLAQRRRFHGAGADAVATDVLPDEIGGHRAGNPDDCGLARAIGEAIGHALDGRGDRRHVDNRTATVGQHRRQEGADHFVHGGDVEVEGEAPVLFGTFEDIAAVHHACAVEQHVQRAHFGGQTLDGGVVGDVQHTFVYALQVVQCRAVDVDGEDLRASIQKCLDAGLTDALGGGSDEHSLTGEVHGDPLLLLLRRPVLWGLPAGHRVASSADTDCTQPFRVCYAPLGTALQWSGHWSCF